MDILNVKINLKNLIKKGEKKSVKSHTRVFLCENLVKTAQSWIQFEMECAKMWRMASEIELVAFWEGKSKKNC